MTSNNAGNKDPLSSKEDFGETHVRSEQSSSATGTSDVTSTEEISKRIEIILRENEQLKKRVLHVENLGRMVSEYKQSNMNLAKENGDLQETVEQLMRRQRKNKQKSGVHLQLDDGGRFSSVKEDEASDSDNETSDDDVDNGARGNTDEGYEIVQPHDVTSVTSSASLSLHSTTASHPILAPSVSMTTMTTFPPPLKDYDDDLSSASRSAQEPRRSVSGEHHDSVISNDNVQPSGGFPTQSILTSGQQTGPEIRHPTSNISPEYTSPNTTALQASAAAAFCERQAYHTSSIPSLSQEINVFNEVLRSENPVSNAELRQLEDIGGVTRAIPSQEQDGDIEDLFTSIDEDGKINSGSVTQQFAKLAGVFARLAQKVMHTQKKARNSQAFCDALLRDNDKLKQELESERKKVASKDVEIKQLTKRKQDATTSSNSQNKSSSSLEETPAKECAETSTAMPSNVTEPSTISKLQNRIRKLEAQRSEVLVVNKQWHSQYNKLKEECNAKLESSKTEMAELKEQITGKQAENAKRKRDIDLLLREAKKEIEILQRQKGDLAKSYALEHGKTQKLNEKIQKIKSDLSCVQAENQRLNQALEAAYSIRQNRQLSGLSLYEENNSSEPTNNVAQPGENLQSTPYGHFEVPSASGEGLLSNTGLPETTTVPVTANTGDVEDMRTQIAVLQQQVKIYREDFETERRDREKSQAEKDRLSEEMTRMRDEMRALNQQVRAYEQDFRQERREKQRLQRQLSRIQVHAGGAGNNVAGGFYYDLDVPEVMHGNDPFPRNVGRRHSSPPRDRHRYPQDRNGDLLIQTATTNAPRRYAERTRSNPPPPYTRDTARMHRRTAATTTTNRRIHDGFLEPVRHYDDETDVVYPPGNLMNQF